MKRTSMLISLMHCMIACVLVARAKGDDQDLPTKSFIYKKSETGRPGNCRPLPARLEGNRQAAQHRVFLRRRLDQRQRQAGRISSRAYLPAAEWSPPEPTTGSSRSTASRQGMRRGRQKHSPGGCGKTPPSSA